MFYTNRFSKTVTGESDINKLQKSVYRLNACVWFFKYKPTTGRFVSIQQESFNIFLFDYK